MMNFSQIERQIVFWRSTTAFGGKSNSISKRAVDTGLPVTASNNMPKSFAKKWSDGDCGSNRLSGRAERLTTSHNPESEAKRSGGRRSSTRRFRLCY